MLRLFAAQAALMLYWRLAQRRADALRAKMEQRRPAFVTRDRIAGRASRRNDRQAPAAPSPASTR